MGAVFNAQKGRYGAIDEGTTAAGAFQPMIVVGISLFQAIKTPETRDRDLTLEENAN